MISWILTRHDCQTGSYNLVPDIARDDLLTEMKLVTWCQTNVQQVVIPVHCPRPTGELVGHLLQ